MCVTDSHLWTLAVECVPSCWPDFSGRPGSFLAIGPHCLQRLNHTHTLLLRFLTRSQTHKPFNAGL